MARRSGALSVAAIVAAVLLAGSGVGLWLAERERHHANAADGRLREKLRESARSDRVRGWDLLRENREQDAFAYLARACDDVPESTLAAEIAACRFNTLGPARQSCVPGAPSALLREPLNRNGLLGRYAKDIPLPPRAAAFTVDGRRVVTLRDRGGNPDHVFQVWDAVSGNLLDSAFIENPAKSIGFPDRIEIGGARFEFEPPQPAGAIEGTDTSVPFKDPVTGASLGRAFGHAIVGATCYFSRDGGRVATCSEDDTARVWETASTRWLTELGDIGESRVFECRFTDDGRRIVGSGISQVHVWDAETGAALAHCMGPGEGWDIVELSGDARFVIYGRVSDSGSSSPAGAELWDVNANARVADLGTTGSGLNAPYFSSNDRSVVIPEKDGMARIVDLPNAGAPLPRVPGAPRWVKMDDGHDPEMSSPDGRLRIAVNAPSSIRILDAATDRLTAEIPLTEKLDCTAFSPDGSLLAAASAGAAPKIFSTRDGSLVATLPDVHPQTVVSMEFRPDGNFLATACWRETQGFIWDTKRWQLHCRLHEQGLMIENIVFSPDGRFVVTTSDRNEGVLNMWEVATGRQIAALEWPSADVRGAVFSPDGHQLLTPARASAEGPSVGVIVWELPGFVGPVPRWFGNFLRWIVQREFNSAGELETMEPHEWHRLRGEIEAAAKADHTRYGEVARWFLASSENRPLRPGSARSRREVADKLVTPEAGPVQIGRAHELDPANALARLALSRFEADPARAKQLRDSALQRLPVPAPSDLQRRAKLLLFPR